MLIRVISCLIVALFLPHSNFPHLGYYPIGRMLVDIPWSSIDTWDPMYDYAYLYIFMGHYLIYVVILFGLSFLLPKILFRIGKYGEKNT